MKKNEFYRLSTFIGYKDKKYEVVKFINNLNGCIVYGAIEHQYLTNGKLNQTLNGLQMHVKKTLNEVIESLQTIAECEEIEDTMNCDASEALAIYFKRHNM